MPTASADCLHLVEAALEMASAGVLIGAPVGVAGMLSAVPADVPVSAPVGVAVGVPEAAPTGVPVGTALGVPETGTVAAPARVILMTVLLCTDVQFQTIEYMMLAGRSPASDHATRLRQQDHVEIS